MRARAPPFGCGPESGPDAPDAGRDRAQTTLDFAVGMSIFLLTVAFVFTFAPNIAEPFSDSGTENTVVADRVASQLVAGTLASPDRPYVLDKACTMAFFWPGNLDGNPGAPEEDLNDSNDGVIQSYGDVSGETIWDSGRCNFELTYLHERLGVAGVAEDGSVSRALSSGLQIEIRGNASDGDGESGLLCVDVNDRDGTDPDEVDPIKDTRNAYEGGTDCDVTGDDKDIPFQAGEDPPEDSGSVVVARRIVTIDGIRATVFVRVW